MRRFTRLTNAFSKKLENHAYSVSLHQMYYNFVRLHQTLRVTPAMAAGVTTKLWEVSDIVAVVEAWEAEQTSHEYLIEPVKIGDGYSVRPLRRYQQNKTMFFPTKEAAETWIEQNQAANRPGLERKIS